jgi:hypothetical protein
VTQYLDLQKPLYARRHAIIAGDAVATPEEIAAGEAQSLKDDEDYTPLPKEDLGECFGTSPTRPPFHLRLYFLCSPPIPPLYTPIAPSPLPAPRCPRPAPRCPRPAPRPLPLLLLPFFLHNIPKRKPKSNLIPSLGKEPEKGIPDFWLTALRNHPGLAELITERDAEALAFLQDVTLEYLPKAGGEGEWQIFFSRGRMSCMGRRPKSEA